MTPNTETEAPACSRELDLTVHFCRTCGILPWTPEDIQAHRGQPENAGCIEDWYGGCASRTPRIRAIRFVAETGAAVRAANPLPQFKWAEAQAP